MEPELEPQNIFQKKIMSGKTIRILLLVIYLIAFVYPAFIWALALGFFSFAGVGLVILVAIPFYVNYKSGKILELSQTERERIVRRNKLIALVIAFLILLYAIFDLYNRGGSLNSVFPFLP
jgi:hypothetical protein